MNNSPSTENQNSSSSKHPINLILYSSLLLLLFILPIRGVFTVSGSITIGKIFGLFVGIIWLVSIIIQKPKIPMHNFHIAAVLFIFVPLLSIAWSGATTATTLASIRNIFVLVLILLIPYVLSEKKTVKPALAAYVVGTVVLCVLLLLSYITGNAFSPGRYTVANLNPNSVAFSIVFSVPCAIYLFRKSIIKRSRIFVFFVVVFLIFGVILTGSRTALIGVLSIFVFYTFYVVSLNPVRYIPIVVVLMAPIFIFSYILLPAEFINRFSTIPHEVLQGDLATRTVQWAAGVSLFQANPLVGVGLGAFPQLIEPLIGYSVATDNTYLQVVYELGILGAVISSYLLLSAARLYHNSDKRGIRVEFASMIACCLVMGVANDFAYHPILWTLLSVLASNSIMKNE